ncbi:hypothetical protein, partial [Salmonella enterica]|uniref:hypothetical protein n=1 Tax=Salmonella enterica TaxID=28901 RepID=UPI00329A57AC
SGAIALAAVVMNVCVVLRGPIARAMAAFVMHVSWVLSGARTMAMAAFGMSFALVLLFFLLGPSHVKAFFDLVHDSRQFSIW